MQLEKQFNHIKDETLIYKIGKTQDHSSLKKILNPIA